MIQSQTIRNSAGAGRIEQGSRREGRGGLSACSVLAVLAALGGLGGGGGVAFGQANYLILVADTATATEPIRASLLGTGLVTNVAIHPFSTTLPTPTLAELLAYDAVITWSNSSYADGAAMGDVLADYVDAGGGVVVAVYAVSTTTANRSLTGRWQTGGYDIIPQRSGNATAATALGTVHLPAHPLWNGMTGFAGTANFARAATIDAAPHAVRIADWATGGVLAATSLTWPNRVDLNFYPAAWHSTPDGARLLANALITAGAGGTIDPGGCCFADGSCQVLTPLDCANQSGSFRGGGTDCTSPCPQPGACCLPSGACEVNLEVACASGGGTWQGAGTDCTINSCPQPATGACCLGGGACVIDWAGGCQAQGGFYQGDNTACATVTCPVSLTTTLVGGNAQAGAMFDLTALNRITITGFDYLSSSELAPSMQEIEIYHVSDRTSFVGKDADPSQWTLIERVAVERQPSPVAAPNPTRVALSSGFTMEPGETIGIYFTRNAALATTSIRYTNGPLGAFSTPDLIFEDRGLGKSYPFLSNFNPRIWNGTIYYQLEGGGCYANCDGSTVEPLLNVDDFTCFINEYASAQSLPHEQQVTAYANCDGSTTAPALNVDDFTCFINQYAQGCP
jgi:hypothetical protein